MNDPLFWHQGLFLQPQHFQVNDRHTASLLKPLYRYICPFFWGVKTIEIIETALPNFILDISRGEFLFQDTTHIRFPGNAVLESRSFEGAWEDGSKTFKVYLGLKKFDDDGNNVTITSDLSRLHAINSRFISLSDPKEVRDLHHSGPSAEIKTMSHVLKLFWETEVDQAGDHLLLPVAMLERRRETIVLSETYVPPVLTLSGSDILQGISREIMDQLGARSRQLESGKHDRGVHTAEFGSRDMVFMLALRSLNRYVPLLRHINDEGLMHPWHVYGILRQVAGELSSFNGEINANGEMRNGKQLLPDYDHRRLWQCYHAVQELITLLIDDITAGPEYRISLHWDGTYFSGDLPPQIFDEHNRYFLVLNSDTDEQLLADAMSNLIKISSRAAMPTLIVQALPGMKARHLGSPPRNLPRIPGAAYFKIDHRSSHWQEIRSSNVIALLWDQAPEDLRVELMVLRREES